MFILILDIIFSKQMKSPNRCHFDFGVKVYPPFVIKVSDLIFLWNQNTISELNRTDGSSIEDTWKLKLPSAQLLLKMIEGVNVILNQLQDRFCDALHGINNFFWIHTFSVMKYFFILLA